LQPDDIEIQEVNNWLHQSTLLAGPAHETEHLCQNRDIVIDFRVGMACSRHRDELVFDVQLIQELDKIRCLSWRKYCIIFTNAEKHRRCTFAFAEVSGIRCVNGRLSEIFFIARIWIHHLVRGEKAPNCLGSALQHQPWTVTTIEA